MILSKFATIQVLQQHASDGGLRTQNNGKRRNAQTVTSMDNQRYVPYIEGHHAHQQQSVSHGHPSFLYIVRNGHTEAHK